MAKSYIEISSTKDIFKYKDYIKEAQQNGNTEVLTETEFFEFINSVIED